jgi:hypothetical protein
MARSYHIEIAGEAAILLANLMRKFGDTKPSIAVARALGLSEAAMPFIHDGMLTVLDPSKADDDDDDERLVDLVVETTEAEREVA